MQLLAPLLEPRDHSRAIWITHRSPQSESILAGKRAFFVPEVHARDWRAVLKATPGVMSICARNGVDRIYSTGAALALAGLPAAPLIGARPVFVESLARADGPSLAGRVLERLPWVPVYTQHPANQSERWRYRTSILDSFVPDQRGPVAAPRRIFVTVGTTRPWQFGSLLRRVLEIAPQDAVIRWQTGVTDIDGLPIDAQPMLSDAEFAAEIEQADVVVSHAGCGSFIRCLQAGKVPILVPRRAARGEHVDDHQEQIAMVASKRGLAISREVDELSSDDLALAASMAARPAAHG